MVLKSYKELNSLFSMKIMKQKFLNYNLQIAKLIIMICMWLNYHQKKIIFNQYKQIIHFYIKTFEG